MFIIIIVVCSVNVAKLVRSQFIASLVELVWAPLIQFNLSLIWYSDVFTGEINHRENLSHSQERLLSQTKTSSKTV